MPHFSSSLLVIASFFLLASCQQSKLYRSKSNISLSVPTQKPVYSVFLIGDAGKASANEPTLQTLQKELQNSGKQSAVLFLGDNIYPAGLPDSLHPSYQEAVTYLNRQLQTVKNYEGTVLFIAGNHDWNMSRQGGQAAVKRQEQYVEKYLGRGNTFLPDSACPDAAPLLLHDSLVVVPLDTEWWFHEHEKPQGNQSPCPSKNKAEFFSNLQCQLAQHQNKRILVAAHHPIISNSKYFTWKSHLFPLTDFNPRWWLPLPVLGSLYVGYRKLGLSRHDLMHRNAKNLHKGLLSAFGNVPLLYVAGHDHNLQLHKKNKQYFVVSGAGSKLRAVPKRHKALFVANCKGFAVLRFYENSEAILEFIDEKGKVLSRWKMVSDATK